MNKFLILASLLIATISCEKGIEEPTKPNKGTEVTLTASLKDAVTETRITANTDNDEEWTFDWEEGDIIAGWYAGCTEPAEFTTKTYDKQSSTFSGTVIDGTDYRFVYPRDFRNVSGNFYTIGLSYQDNCDNLSRTYMINDGLINSGDIVNSTVSNLTMKHVGSFMVVDVYLENFDNDKTYKLETVEYSSKDNVINIATTIDMTKGVEDMYESFTPGEIHARMEAEFKEVKGTKYRQAITRLNMLPSIIGQNQTATIVMSIGEYDSEGDYLGSYMPEVTIMNNSGADLPIARAVHNFTYITADISSDVKITDAKINDWGEVVESGNLDLVEAVYTASQINAGNVPPVDNWIVTDESLSKDSAAGIKDALKVAYNQGRKINLVLPNATIIQDKAFSAASSALYSIDIPKVKTIGEDAFSSCRGLNEVRNSDNVESIGESGFAYSGITSFDLKSCKTIGERGLGNCYSLREVKNTGNLENIGKWAFVMDSEITTFDFTGCKTIGETAFYDCSKLAEVTNTSGIETIGIKAFGFSAITSFDFTSVSTLGASAFANCESLSNLTNTHNVKVIGDRAFQNDELITSFDFASVTSVGEYAFSECVSLANISNTSNIETIKPWAFGNCSFQAIDLSSVTSMGNNAFNSCDNLTTVTNLSELKVIPSSAFYSTGLESIEMSNVEEMEDGVFWNCNGLTEVEIPSTLSKIGNYVFRNAELSKVVLNWSGDEILQYNSNWAIDESANIFVPQGTIKDYEAKGWNVFTIIEQ